MKRHLVTLAIAGALAAQSSALINLNLNPQTYTTTSAGGVVTILGSVTKSASDSLSAVVATAAFSGANSLPTPVFTADFLAYIAANTGNFGTLATPLAIATITVPAGQTAGLYDAATAAGTPGASITLTGFNNASTPAAAISDSEFYSVQVDAVPEPASFAALGLGVAALLRRRRRA